MAPPFYSRLGIEIVATGGEASHLRLPANPVLANSRGQVHGGALAALIDATIGQAAGAAPQGHIPTATITLTVTFLEPGVGELHGHGTVLRRGRSMVSVEARVVDGAGRLVAHGVGTVRAMTPRPPAT